jgi:ketosteroid isomerase-like protein
MYKFHSLVLFCFLLLLSCNVKKGNTPSNNSEKNRQELLVADNSFSEACLKDGMKNAYLDYIDSNGVLLRPNNFPIIGAEAIDFIIAQNDADFKMSWKASDAIVAQSGELGYTYGEYKLHLTKPDTTFVGTYVTIWKKQDDNRWKFVLDTNNEGLAGE